MRRFWLGDTRPLSPIFDMDRARDWVRGLECGLDLALEQLGAKPNQDGQALQGLENGPPGDRLEQAPEKGSVEAEASQGPPFPPPIPTDWALEIARGWWGCLEDYLKYPSEVPDRVEAIPNLAHEMREAAWCIYRGVRHEPPACCIDGWVPGENGVERCDECARFKDDDEAAAYVANILRTLRYSVSEETPAPWEQLVTRSHRTLYVDPEGEEDIRK